MLHLLLCFLGLQGQPSSDDVARAYVKMRMRYRAEAAKRGVAPTATDDGLLAHVETHCFFFKDFKRDRQFEHLSLFQASFEGAGSCDETITPPFIADYVSDHHRAPASSVVECSASGECRFAASSTPASSGGDPMVLPRVISDVIAQRSISASRKALDSWMGGGGHVDARDPDDGSTMLMAATRRRSHKGSEDVVAALLQRGASVDLQDWGGGTALIYASDFNHLAVVRELLTAGANPALGHPITGDTAVDIAEHKGHAAVARVIRVFDSFRAKQETACSPPTATEALQDEQFIVVGAIFCAILFVGAALFFIVLHLAKFINRRTGFVERLRISSASTGIISILDRLICRLCDLAFLVYERPAILLPGVFRLCGTWLFGFWVAFFLRAELPVLVSHCFVAFVCLCLLLAAGELAYRAVEATGDMHEADFSMGLFSADYGPIFRCSIFRWVYFSTLFFLNALLGRAVATYAPLHVATDHVLDYILLVTAWSSCGLFLILDLAASAEVLIYRRTLEGGQNFLVHFFVFCCALFCCVVSNSSSMRSPTGGETRSSCVAAACFAAACCCGQYWAGPFWGTPAAGDAARKAAPGPSTGTTRRRRAKRADEREASGRAEAAEHDAKLRDAERARLEAEKLAIQLPTEEADRRIELAQAEAKQRGAEEKARRQEERARREAEDRVQREADDTARREAEKKVRREFEEKRREVEEKARREAERRREAEERERRRVLELQARAFEDHARRQAEKSAEEARREAARVEAAAAAAAAAVAAEAAAAAAAAAAPSTAQPAAAAGTQEEAPPLPPAVSAEPDAHLCPITQMVMVDPVVAADGHSYERTDIVKWLLKKDTSPLTGKLLPHKALTPNHTLRKAIGEWAEVHGATAAAASGTSSNAHPAPTTSQQAAAGAGRGGGRGGRGQGRSLGGRGGRGSSSSTAM